MREAKVKTKNISLSKEKYAKINEASKDIVDFTILKILTLIKAATETEFVEFNESIQEKYDTEDKMIDHHIEFKQLYTIKLFEKQSKDYFLNYEVQFDSLKVNPKIVIKTDSKIPDSSLKETYVWLLNEINKIKAENNILLNLFDETYLMKLKLFTKYIHAGKFKKSIKLPLIETITPNITRKAELLLNYKNKKEHHQFLEVNKGDILVQFAKPKFGRNGLDAFGDVISAEMQTNEKDFKYDIDEDTIEVVEDETKKQYISKTKGYVNFSKNLLFIDHTIKKRKVKRVDDTISEHEDNDIKVVVSEKDITQDSIGEGVKLSSETIHVEGFVGSNSKLNATDLIIDGATHQNSYQTAKNATINRHKGTVRARKVDIKFLEGGTIYATTVNIGSCLTGTIYAKDVTINSVKSNLKVYASHSIKIKVVTGDNNTFNINYKKIPTIAKKLEFIDHDIEDLKFNLEEAKRHQKSKVAEIETQIKKFESTKKEIQNSVYDSFIHVEKSFRGINKIIFTINDKKELTYRTDSKKYPKFYLEHKGEKVTLKPVNLSIEL